MTDIKFKPIRHDHKPFVENASKRKGFAEAYDALALECQLVNQMLKGLVPGPALLRTLLRSAWALPRALSRALSPLPNMPRRSPPSNAMPAQ